jgi:hypothetical protein
MNHLSTRSLAAILAVASTLTAQTQTATRTEFQLSSGTVTTSTFGFAGWQIAAPAQSLPADAASGLAPTARVMYAIWPDANANGQVVLRCLRSVDSGWSWDPAQAVDIWTANTAAGETFDTENLQIHASNHKVFVVLTTDRDPSGAPDPQTDDSCWVLGSDDQGQTWQAVNVSPGLYTPLPNGADFNDIDEPWAALGAGDRLHVSFEADYDDTGAGASSTNEDLYYQAVEFDAAGNLVAVFPNERQVNTTAPGAFDVDRPSCAAAGNILVFVWHDARVNGGDIDDTFSRVSTDAGASFGQEHNHTNVTADESEDVSYALVSGSTILVTQEDGRLGSPDRIWGSLSFDSGSTWTDGLLLSKGPANIDVDNYDVDVTSNGTFVIGYQDDREGPTNVDNDIYVVVDRNGGQDFLNGTHTEVQLSTGADNDTMYDVKSYGDVIAVAAETSNFPEDAGVYVSRDDGASFEYFAVRSGQVADVDDIYVAVGINGDVQVIWQDDANLGNEFNNVYTRGLKTQRLREDPALGLVYEGGTAADQGDLVVLFPSLTAPVSNGTTPPLPAMTGVAYDFVLDGTSAAALANLGLFFGAVDATGRATFRLGPINLAQVIGADIHWIGVTFDGPSGAFTRAYTDPYLQR